MEALDCFYETVPRPLAGNHAGSICRQPTWCGGACRYLQGTGGGGVVAGDFKCVCSSGASVAESAFDFGDDGVLYFRGECPDAVFGGEPDPGLLGKQLWF